MQFDGDKIVLEFSPFLRLANFPTRARDAREKMHPTAANDGPISPAPEAKQKLIHFDTLFSGKGSEITLFRFDEFFHPNSPLRDDTY
jgi:hypothetical protein